MKFNIISVLPDIFSSLFASKIIRSAKDNGLLNVDLINPRDFTTDIHKTIDRPPIGGGAGMVMMYAPLKKALLSIKDKPAINIYFSPRGKKLTQDMLVNLSKNYQNFNLVCGRYEGIDQRFIDNHIDLEISIGDYIMTGGELAAMVFFDAISRLKLGVLANENSLVEESFNNGRLEYDLYTKPNETEGLSVPEVLLSGNHKKIATWKMESSIIKTFENRPDLLTKYPVFDDELKILKKYLKNK